MRHYTKEPKPPKEPKAPKAPKSPRDPNEPKVPRGAAAHKRRRMERQEAVEAARAGAPAKLPLHLPDGVVLHSLGRVDLRPGFHDESHIYPVGYRTTWTNPAGTAAFTSEIIAPPLFPLEAPAEAEVEVEEEAVPAEAEVKPEADAMDAEGAGAGPGALKATAAGGASRGGARPVFRVTREILPVSAAKVRQCRLTSG